MIRDKLRVFSFASPLFKGDGAEQVDPAVYTAEEVVRKRRGSRIAGSCLAPYNRVMPDRVNP